MVGYSKRFYHPLQRGSVMAYAIAVLAAGFLFLLVRMIRLERKVGQ